MTTEESETVLYSDVDLGYLDSVSQSPNRRDTMSTNLWIKKEGWIDRLNNENMNMDIFVYVNIHDYSI